MKSTLLLLFSLLLLSSCESEPERGVVEVDTDGSISSIIRSPVRADGPVDTINVAKMQFDEVLYDFGETRRGEVVEHTYRFRNVGRIPLVISNARSTCGCTVPRWPEQPVQPGDGGEIVVRFDTKDQEENYQNKPIEITANTYPSKTELRLIGRVVE